MVYERTGYAPWSLTREAGVQSATVDGTIQVPQYVYPNLDTGFLDEKGNWKGRKSSDEVFTIDAPHIGVANGATVLVPQTANRDFIDMTGYNDLYVAFRVSNGGDCAIQAVMGPDTNTFANLTPVNAASGLRGLVIPFGTANDFENIFNDAAETLTADVWNIFSIFTVLKGQKNLQFKITNNSGGSSDIEFAFLRVV
jgi:hypothetical protein